MCCCIALELPTILIHMAAAAVVIAVHVKAWHCQAALAVTQLLFCIGSVYLKSSLLSLSTLGAREFHPIVYAFVREAVAGPVMCMIAYAQSGVLSSSRRLAMSEAGPAWHPCLQAIKFARSTRHISLDMDLHRRKVGRLSPVCVDRAVSSGRCTFGRQLSRPSCQGVSCWHHLGTAP